MHNLALCVCAASGIFSIFQSTQNFFEIALYNNTKKWLVILNREHFILTKVDGIYLFVYIFHFSEIRQCRRFVIDF